MVQIIDRQIVKTNKQSGKTYEQIRYSWAPKWVVTTYLYVNVYRQQTIFADRENQME